MFRQNSPSCDLLLGVLSDPPRFCALTDPERSMVIRFARRELVLGRLAAMLHARGLLAGCEGKCRDLLEAALAEADYHARKLRWAMDRVLRALAGHDIRPVLLKGGAYLQAGLAVAEGRLVSDLDILVSRGQLVEVEQALLSDGWTSMKLDAYDQDYYRNWMHELPPMQHGIWGLVVDVHHAILPETSRLRPDSGHLLASAVPTNDPRLRVLAPADMVLHNCVHLFYDGDLSHGLRELVDLAGLLEAFSQEQGFWQDLVDRASILGLTRPLYYGLSQVRSLLGVSVPEQTLTVLRPYAPVWPLRGMILAAMARLLRPRRLEAREPLRALIEWLFYVRSHWLRMPPLLLARHLLTKARKRATVSRA
jgi:hypothetical protein